MCPPAPSEAAAASAAVRPRDPIRSCHVIPTHTCTLDPLKCWIIAFLAGFTAKSADNPTEKSKDVGWQQSDKAVKRQGCLSRHLTLSWSVPYPRVKARLSLSLGSPDFVVYYSQQTFQTHTLSTPHSNQHTAHGTTQTQKLKIAEVYKTNKKRNFPLK